MFTYQLLSRPIGEIGLFFEGDALVCLSLTAQLPENPLEGLPPALGGLPFAEEETAASVAMIQWLDDYLAGSQRPCPVQVKLYGTPFQQSVWEALLRLPYGETCTYGELAAQIGSGGVRAVGTAVGKNPIPILIPCHRVLPAAGGLGNYSAGAGQETKERLLVTEGAIVTL